MTSKILPNFVRTDSSENQVQIVTSLLLFWAVVFGIIVRLLPVAQTSFPLNDGGLFYNMASDLIKEGFRLPAFASYNQAGIPFAYPPLGIYILAVLAQILPQLALVQWLPFVYSVLTIPAFYLLAKTVLQDPIKAGLATAAFALIPSSTDILIWGGGVTRGLGFLFGILTAQQLIRLFRDQQWKMVIPAALLTALVVLSHPSAAFVTALLAVVFWFWYGQNLRSAAQAIVVGGAVLVLTLPWWLAVIQNHGLEAFRAGLGSGWFTLVFAPFITLNTTREPFMTVVMTLAVIGLVHSLSRRQLLLPLWFFTCLLSQRDGYVYASVPVSLLFSSAVIDLVVPAFAKFRPEEEGAQTQILTGSSRWLITFVLLYSLVNAVIAAEKIRPIRVTPAEQEAMAWAAENTPTDARFLLLTFGDPLNTPFQEWFPAVTERNNLTAVQGYEWLPDSVFTKRKDDFNRLQPCLTQRFECVELWAVSRQIDYDYLLVHHTYVGTLDANEGDVKINQWISTELADNPEFRQVYRSGWIEIYEYLPASG